MLSEIKLLVDSQKKGTPSYSDLVKLGFIPELIHLLSNPKDQHKEVIREALWLLCNVISADPTHTSLIVASKGIPCLVQLLFDYPETEC